MPRKAPITILEAPIDTDTTIIIDNERLVIRDNCVVNTLSNETIDQPVQGQVITTDAGTLCLLVPVMLAAKPNVIPNVMLAISEVLSAHNVGMLTMEEPTEEDDSTDEENAGLDPVAAVDEL